MRILFVFSDYLLDWYGDFSSVLFDFISELRRRCDVRCVFLAYKHRNVSFPQGIVDAVFSPECVFEAFSTDARILECAASVRAGCDEFVRTFMPDIIHCNDRQSFLPFRFDRHVLYSSRMIFQDSVLSSVITDIDFYEEKLERCAVENCDVLCVSSPAAANLAERLSGGQCVPVVVPPGISYGKSALYRAGRESECLYVGQKEFYGGSSSGRKKINSVKKNSGSGRTVRVGFFCGNGGSALAERFVSAVRRLGGDFRRQYKAEYFLYTVYGTSEKTHPLLCDFPHFDDVTVIRKDFSEDAYGHSDVAVISSACSPLDAAGLFAMRTGCLVLILSGGELPLYAKPGWNCILATDDAGALSETVRDAVQNFEKYRFIRENAVRTALFWSVERSASAQHFVYRQLYLDRVSFLNSAYRSEERRLLEKYRRSDDAEKAICAQRELFLCSGIVDFLLKQRKYRKILLLTGACSPGKVQFPPQVESFSVLNESEFGFVVRPECLPFDDGEFDAVVSAGSWETVIEPCGALVEMQRVGRKTVVILYNSCSPHSWQTFRMDDEKDFSVLSGTDWEMVSAPPDISCIAGDLYCPVVFEKKSSASCFHNAKSQSETQ